MTDIPAPEPPTHIEGDSVLSKHGEAQAVELGEFLKSIEPKVDRIYSSPFYRCLQTSEPASQYLNLEIYPETGFGEWYKRERLTHPSAASPSELKKFFPTVKEDYKSLVQVPVEGETEEELHERSKLAFQAVLEDINKNSPDVKTILVVSHAATRIGLGRALVGERYLNIRTGVCSLDRFVLEQDKESKIGNFRMEYSGKCDFLKEGEEMHWSFENMYAPGSTEDMLARLREKSANDDDNNNNNKNGKINKLLENNEEETTSVYIPLDMSQDVYRGGPSYESVIPAGAGFQVVEIASDKPMFKIGDKVFEGDWQNIVGTEVYTDVEGRPVGSSRTRIQLNPASLEDKTEEVKPSGKKESLLDRIKQIDFKRQLKEEDNSVNGK